MQFRAAAAVLLTLAVPGAMSAGFSASAAAYQAGEEWTIGPIVNGRNRSRGMPYQPTPGPRGSFHFDLPQAGGSVNYVTFPHGSLAGKRRIVMRYRVVTAPGVKIVPKAVPAAASMITLYFQRGGDNWSARGPYETYRWYASFATQSPITPGEHTIVAPLNANWTAVMTSSAKTQPAAFRAALEQADQVGFVLGGGDGLGHGVFATGPARLIVTSFRVE